MGLGHSKDINSRGTLPGVVDGAGNLPTVFPRGSLVQQMQARAVGPIDQVIFGHSDSTGNEDTEWFRRLCDYLAVQMPADAHVVYRLYNDGTGRYGTPVVLREGGGQPYVTVGVDGRGWGIPYSTAGAAVDLDARIDVALDVWTGVAGQSLLSQFGNTGFRSWYVYINTAGALYVNWLEADGTTSRIYATAAPLSDLSAGARKFLRVLVDVDNGAGGHTVTFQQSTDDGGAWTNIGSPIVTAGVSSILTVDKQAVEIGSRGAPNESITAGAVSGGKGRYYAAHFSAVINGPNKLPGNIRETVEFNGMAGTRSPAPYVNIYNGAIPGANMGYWQTGDRFERMVPKCAEAVHFLNTSHNEEATWEPLTFRANLAAYYAALTSRIPVQRRFIITQNPQKAPRSATQIYGQARRADFLPLFAALPDIKAEVIDTYPLFAGHADWINVDGIHPGMPGRDAMTAKAIQVAGGA